jgi:hypothetical protein
MTIYEEPEPDKAEKITRFGCGALFGVVIGIGLAIRFAFSSLGFIAAIIVGAILICGYLALKFGDEFWPSIKDWWWWL